MSGFTYRQLAKMIEEMPEEHKDDNVSLAMDTEEVIPMKGFCPLAEYSEDMADILDEGHFVLFCG